MAGVWSWLSAVGLGLAIAVSHGRTPVSRHVLLLGIDLVSIDVPVGLSILHKSELEHGEYEIQRASGRRVMRIVIDQGLRDSVVDNSRTHYCVNGIEGVTNLKSGIRKVLLHLPPGDYENSFFFEYREGDATAAAVMKSFRQTGNRRRC